MQRQLNLKIDIANKAIVSSGDNGFYIGDSNKIAIELSEQGDYVVVINALIPAGPVISTGAEKQEDGTYLVEELDAFLMKVGKVKAQVVVSLGDERLTVNEFEFESLLAFGQSNMAVSPDVQSLNEFYAALHVLESINLAEIENAVDVIQGLDIEQLEAIQLMARELTDTLDNAKEQTEQLSTLINIIEQKLENGEFNGKDGENGKDGQDGAVGPEGPQGPKGDKGDKGDTGEAGQNGKDGKDGEIGPTGPQGPEGPAGKDGEDYVLTEDDKQEIAGIVSSEFTQPILAMLE